jgi:hypothetical protein
MNNDNPILSAVLALVAEGYHPSIVRVTRISASHWSLSVVLDDWCTHGEGGDLPNHAVMVDLANLPDGLRFAGRERMQNHTGTIDGSEEAVETWIRQVAEAGKATDWAIIEPDSVGKEYVTKPVEWLREPLRSALLRSKHANP